MSIRLESLRLLILRRWRRRVSSLSFTRAERLDGRRSRSEEGSSSLMLDGFEREEEKLGREASIELFYSVDAAKSMDEPIR